MGIDTHALNFIKYVSKQRPMGRVATVGRQTLQLPELAARYGRYCDEFLQKNFGATLVDSYDFSDYEGATYIVDMNEPLAEERRYDTVIDCGCLEHVFNAPQALKNVSRLCDIGGQIIHVLPANNFCGHGFWQFSPELFFSLYSDANGYTATQVFLADLSDLDVWYAVERPTTERAEVTSKGPVYVMCATVKHSDCSKQAVQQSDYVPLWNAAAQSSREIFGESFRKEIKKVRWLYRWLLVARNAAGSGIRRVKNPTSLSARNRHLRKHNVSALLSA
jgi:hypothetical protein